ncbi:MAG TPA: hypothetical protein VMA95_03400, partial [Streptosporangiaceae bacterium]|nr:hypothetical protein [Streptosporangiaceae bacterium]
AEKDLDSGHATAIRDVAIANLRDFASDDLSARAQFRKEFNQNALISAFQAQPSADADSQLNALTEILRYAYGGELTLPDARRVLGDLQTVPGAPLVAATLRLVGPRDRTTIVREFLFRYFASSGFGVETFRELRRLVTDEAANPAVVSSHSPRQQVNARASDRNATVLGCLILTAIALLVACLVIIIIHVL